MLAQVDAAVEEVVLNPRRNIHRVKRAIKGARVEILEAGTLIDAAIYDAPVGGNLLVGPFITNAVGRVIHPDSSLLFSVSQDLDVVATKGGRTWSYRYPAISASDIGGVQLAIAKLESISNLVASGAPGDFTGMVIDVPPHPHPVMIEVFSPYLSYTGSSGARLGYIYISDAAEAKQIIVADAYIPLVNDHQRCFGSLEIEAPDEEVQYKVQGQLSAGAGSIFIGGGTGLVDGGLAPGFIRAVGT